MKPPKHLLSRLLRSHLLLGRLLRALRPKRCRWFCLTVTVWMAVAGVGLPGAAQIGRLGGLSAPDPLSSDPPANVERFGTFETAPVYFENRLLFRVAAPTVWNRAVPGNQLLVEGRAEQIQTNLKRIIDSDENPIQRPFTTAFDPNSLQVEIASQNGQTLLRAKDHYHSQPQDLLTVTELDAKLYSLSIAELAQQRQQQLQTELETALRARLPDAMARQMQQALRVLLITTGLSLGLWLLQRPMRRRAKTLRTQQALHQEMETNGMAAMANADREPLGEQANGQMNGQMNGQINSQINGQFGNRESALAAASAQADFPRANSVTHRFHFLDNLRSRFSLERRHSLNALLRWLLLWGQATIWIVGITQILSIFPQSQALAARVWATPIALVLVWFATGAVNRLGDVLINRFSHVLEEDDFFTFEGVQRKCLRLSTVIRVTKGVKTFGIYVAGCLWALNILGVPLSSLLTVSAAIALAVSLASQNLIKDLVNGVLILSEDQYGIGDFITVGTVTGLVENMNLRITQLRNAEGRLITIPNSLIAQVENLTRLWSRVDFTIEVAYDTDLKQALALLEQVGQQMYSEPEWQPLLLKPPDVLGIEHLSHAGAQIRIWLQTQPLQQWKVGREFRLRVWQALTDHQIPIGVPQQIFRSGLDDPQPDLSQTPEMLGFPQPGPSGQPQT